MQDVCEYWYSTTSVQDGYKYQYSPTSLQDVYEYQYSTNSLQDVYEYPYSTTSLQDVYEYQYIRSAADMVLWHSQLPLEVWTQVFLFLDWRSLRRSRYKHNVCLYPKARVFWAVRSQNVAVPT